MRPAPCLGWPRLRAQNPLHGYRITTVTAIRHNPAIRTFYTRLCQQGKPKKVAPVVAKHKLLLFLNSVVQDQIP